MFTTVRVPATTANIGPGFDCLGAALTLYNEFTFNRSTSDRALTITVAGINAEQVGRNADNLVYQAFSQLFQHIGQAVPPISLHIQMNVPLSRGLGSSATAIIGGLVGANELAGQPLSQAQLAELATVMEGHPDNVVPALLGGARISAVGIERAWEVAELVWHPQIVPVVAIPDFELSTQSARSVLPETYSRSDAVFNTSHLALLLQGLAMNNADWLKAALQDKIHQPFRQSLIVGYEAVHAAAIAAGAHGLVISGAGPTLLALCPAARAEAVSHAMLNTWKNISVNATTMVLRLDTTGTVVRV
ncbi:homoserine kinase [Romeriopsis navalis]|uniref:homoserine kinase n=1 Tax=Romeriopsis navalis TaxID=2992132 RepID=UPI0021F88AAA|nr:homoserine kinase [Romeriopsis navalis]